jgi:hypothetical protein
MNLPRADIVSPERADYVVVATCPAPGPDNTMGARLYIERFVTQQAAEAVVEFLRGTGIPARVIKDWQDDS